jgi:hypothetical protein
MEMRSTGRETTQRGSGKRGDARRTGQRAATPLNDAASCASHCHRGCAFETVGKRLAQFERELHRNLARKRRAMIETAIAWIVRRRLLTPATPAK